MKFLPLIWAWAWHRPARTVLGLVCVVTAFALYGLALGMAESFHREAALRRIATGPEFLIGALAISAIGMGLILFLTASATAQSVRQRLAEFDVMKAIGYSHGLILALVAAQGVVTWLAGAGLGLVTAKMCYTPVLTVFPALAGIPTLIYRPGMLAAAAGLAVIIGALSVLPAARILRLEATEALNGGLRTAPGPGEPTHYVPAAAVPKPQAPVPLALQLAEKAEMHLLRQTAAVTIVGLSTLRYRLRGVRTVVVAVGIVAFLLLGGLSCAEGIRLGLLTSGDPARVVLSQINERWEEDKLSPQVTMLAAAAPGVAHGHGGALAEGQVSFSLKLIKRNNGNEGTVKIVGVGPRWLEMAPEFQLLSGRLPRPGAKELIAGDIAARKFSGLDDGQVEFRDMRWRIVGTFRASPWWSAYLLGDADTMKAAAGQGWNNSVMIRLTSAEAFETFRRAVSRKLPPDIRVERETDNYLRYWIGITETAAAFPLTYLLAGLAAFGATAAMIQVMQVTADERARDIAVLRALGFDGIAVALSLVAEALLLSLLGAAAGAAVVWLWFDGTLYNGAGNVFRVTVNLHLLLLAMGWGLVIALLAVFRPALVLARQTPMEALRAV